MLDQNLLIATLETTGQTQAATNEFMMKRFRRERGPPAHEEMKHSLHRVLCMLNQLIVLKDENQNVHF